LRKWADNSYHLREKILREQGDKLPDRVHTDFGRKSSPAVKRALEANDVDAMQSAMDALPRTIMSVGQSVNGVVHRASRRILPALFLT